MPITHPGIPFIELKVDWKIFPKLDKCQCPENSNKKPVIIVTAMLQKSIPA